MLEHQKSVLLGVAKYPGLFKKELIKSLSWLNKDDQKSLVMWVQKEFNSTYPHIINEIQLGQSA